MVVDTAILAHYFDVCQYWLMVDLTPAVTSDCCVPGAATGLCGDDAEYAAGLLKAVADPVRLRLFARIAAVSESVCVCDLQDVGVSQPTVSHHLKKLRDAGLVDCERRGTWVHYWPTELGIQLSSAVSSLVVEGALLKHSSLAGQ